MAWWARELLVAKGPRSTTPTPPPDMLLLKKQTEDISSVYEIREKLGS